MQFIAAIISAYCPFICPIYARERVLPEGSGEYVVLLHGIGRTRRPMEKIEKRLQEADFKVWNERYPSTSKTIKSLTESRIAVAVAFCRRKNATKIHFVTHFMGGILVRLYRQNNRLPAGSRLVMPSPPNHGSEVVDRFRKLSAFKWLFGPAGQELRTELQSMPNQLRPVSADIGVIAGEKSSDPGFQ